MKKIKKLIFLLLIVSITACSSPQVSKEEKLYDRYYQKLLKQDVFETNTSDFSLMLVTNKLNKKYRYDLIVKDTQISMYKIRMLAIISKDTASSNPSLGILEDNKFSLIPNYVDKTNGYYKGVNLSGITKNKKFTVKLLISYYATKSSKKEIVRYFKLYGNATG